MDETKAHVCLTEHELFQLKAKEKVYDAVLQGAYSCTECVITLAGLYAVNRAEAAKDPE